MNKIKDLNYSIDIPLIKSPLFKKELDNGLFIAYISAICSYDYFIIKDRVLNHVTDKFEYKYWYEDFLINDEYDSANHKIASIEDICVIVYKNVSEDCMYAKENDILICVAYTDEKHRNNGYMTFLLSKLKEIYNDKLVVDTYTDELINICKKLEIRSFRNNF